MAEPPPGHLSEMLRVLTELDGKTIHVRLVHDIPPATPAETAVFDRRVRESLDRQHRRRMIAEG